MGYLKMAKRAKAKLSGESDGTQKKKKKPIRTFLKKMLDKMKANKAKRKLNKASKDRDVTREREPNTDRIDNGNKETLLDRIHDAGAAIKSKGGAMPSKAEISEDNDNEAKQNKADELNAGNGKYLAIGAIIIFVILIIIYFATKKK